MSSKISETRRNFMRTSAVVIPVVTLGASLLHSALAAPAPVALGDYKPVFFTADEWTFIQAACDRLIPASADGPGALETNVPVFLDKELNGDYGHASDWYLEGPFDVHASPDLGYQLPYTPREVYRRGIAAASKFAMQQHGKPFDALDDATRDQVLTQLEKNEADFSAFNESQLTASGFFGTLLTDTKQGYLSDPKYGGNKGMGAWKMIGFPGARASYAEWIDQHNVPYPLGPVALDGSRG
ncbi:gluconate 2-dehydrogenase subunit 3 family protein [Paraburkholderia sp.]|uniref:gluconate 2-dehydrogenase subunit 3 family protein n=1 Tax=Paraburkholderia sp. TaxID=1926495 RepID=UPI00239CF444|nr:gluconate 2-dehydrogenase subunit 3 family protein [Paraburkholderia sp.]MDE1180735.1 gluconate 2-dehydrogenase subunit 3 family protein [Paraburkholderia sp.]